MNERSIARFMRGFWATSLGTLASRVLGLVRDMATAALLGFGDGAMDALVVAFRLANLPRRVLGEGALATGLLPVFVAEHKRDPRQAWKTLSVLLTLSGAALALLVLLGEGACFAWWRMAGAPQAPPARVTALVLPYMLFVCLAAQLAAALQGLMRFRAAALAPALLNVCWLAAAWLVAPRLADKTAQVCALAAAIVVAGALQLAVLWAALRRAGFRFECDPAAAAASIRQIGRATGPIALAAAATQLNALADSLLAVGLAAEPGATIAWLGHAVAYPLETGAAAAIYCGERFYQLPVGLLGVSVATVIYPLLARQATRGDRTRVGRDLTLALRLVWFAALPAGVGMMLVARPAVRLLFERGAFTAIDADRAAAVIACYAAATWAYCALPVLARGYYALGNRAMPARIALLAMGANLVLNLALVWPLAERGLALATALTASLQAVLLTIGFSRTLSPLAWRPLASTMVRGAAATALMALGVVLARQGLAGGTTSTAAAWQLGGELAAGFAAYLLAARLLSMEELALLAARSTTRTTPDGLAQRAA